MFGRIHTAVLEYLIEMSPSPCSPWPLNYLSPLSTLFWCWCGTKAKNAMSKGRQQEWRGECEIFSGNNGSDFNTHSAQRHSCHWGTFTYDVHSGLGAGGADYVRRWHKFFSFAPDPTVYCVEIRHIEYIFCGGSLTWKRF